jgi:hypothetical protein
MSEYNFSYDDLDSMIDSASKDFDFSNYFSDSGPAFDFGTLDSNAFSFDDLDSMLADFSSADLGNLDLSGLSGMDFDSIDLGSVLGGDTGLSRSLSNIDLSSGMDFGGLGLTPTGRGQMSIRDPETGATGLTAEGFTSLKDLLGSGTAEEIARYTPGTADYSIRSGLETKDGQGLSADATRGMGLKDMGGAQGLSRYIPAEYGSSVLEDLVKRNSNRIGSIEEALPNQFGDIEEYVNSEIFGDKGLTPFRGTGGTLSRAGFLAQSSAENPLGAQYSLGDPKSFINRSSITGQQATVSPDRTVINNGDGTFKVVTVGDDGKVTTRTIDNTKTIDNTRTGGGGGGNSARTNTQQSGLGALLPLLLALLAMNKGGGGGGGGQNAVIPGLTATQRQTPYAQQQRAPGYRPGQGGITYFEPTQFAPRMAAGGGIARLLDGPGDGVSDSIPAVIEDEGMAGGGQPAKLARGEYVIDARTVAALGNGSTDAGAERLDKMRKNILRDDRKAGVGKDSKAHRHLLA